VDTTEVNRFLRMFARRHRVILARIAYSQTQTLELALAVAAAQHYALSGFSVTTVNPRGNVFVVKTSTRGHPANFSRFLVEKGGTISEIHMNLMVSSAHDEGTYCVDLAVCHEGIVPRSSGGPKWERLPNNELVAFAEAKKLVVYPMLIAQFIGIVHEIMPSFLSGPNVDAFLAWGHFPPTLVSLGYFSGNSLKIVGAFRSRGIAIQVLDNFDVRLAQLRGGTRQSPFDEYRVLHSVHTTPGLEFATSVGAA
jgi:hypothetical protein